MQLCFLIGKIKGKVSVPVFSNIKTIVCPENSQRMADFLYLLYHDVALLKRNTEGLLDICPGSIPVLEKGRLTSQNNLRNHTVGSPCPVTKGRGNPQLESYHLELETCLFLGIIYKRQCFQVGTPPQIPK